MAFSQFTENKLHYPDSARRRRGKIWVWGCLGLVALGLVVAGLAVIALMPWGDPFNEAPRHQDMNDPSFRKLVEQRTGISFPATVSWKGCHMEAWQDTCILIGCLMPKRDVVKLVPKKDIQWTRSERGITTDPHEPWFDPDSIKRFRYAEINYPTENCFLRILYDDSVSSDALTAVYIMWNDM